ncbi:DUF547 domain-containing protein [uncultured Lacinutrix sp.]|uniref:DUF547 domain-containing protein n=1 Tax=uncultured Lacinutrix sp. TaxID=574032 RepID=UPI00262B925F|nr:DUF547 domain-containing protein [uncultured Lacinutrix sp.]
MKYLTLFLIAIILSSCCSTKRVVQNTPKKEVAQVVSENTKAPETIETPIQETEQDVVEEEIIKVETPAPVDVIKIKEPETIIASPEAFNHTSWNTLLNTYVTKKGNVNYKGFKSNRKSLTNYISSLSKNMPTNTWSKEDKLAYWINAYNAMTIDLIVRNYPIQSIKDIKDPWKQRLWKLGSKWYNLDEIEHQILRKMNEPRIHFGIVCASFSCPKLQNKAFTASNLESLLTNATKEFLSDSQRNNISENNIKLSKIFKWFAKDFKTRGSIIDFINNYSDISVSNKAKKSFKDYNWDLNE